MLWDGIKKGNVFVSVIILIGVMAAGLVMPSLASVQSEGTVVDDWASIKAPSSVELKSVRVNVKETAFLDSGYRRKDMQC